MSDLKELAARLKYNVGKLLKEFEPKEDEACHLHRLAEDAEDANAEYETRLYRDTVQGLVSDLNDAKQRLHYLLGDIDAEGELYFCQPNERWRLPTTNGRSDDYCEFSCGMLIEVWDTERCHNLSSGEWSKDRVEYSHSDDGYYLYYAKKPLVPGMRARHRHNSSWDD